MSSHFLLQRIFSLQGSNLDPEILLNFRQICYHLSHQKIPGYIIFAVVVQSLSHVWLWNPMDCTMPGFPVLPHLPELAQLRPTELVMPSNHLLLCHPLLFLLSIFPASGSFLMSWLFTSVGQIIGASASASVLPMNIQDWFPLELTGLISLQLMGLSSHVSHGTIKSLISLQSKGLSSAKLSNTGYIEKEIFTDTKSYSSLPSNYTISLTSY